ncbi:helix-turn-helix transcriptional regulator [Pseudomaricurvus alkylphenolicus]|uniref:helix-turn-helix domain-containing protein n=1 Tax=Pseudomaricurvus alkylphenolicus TaxID=1306991 RepID=UPI00141F41DD|nr:AraC family transcriptional regulator [Pseudomaricurvus alkylphenolicus]NIB38173.1 helix-turn-helix transcriptional regulator [Pseudomaricurvus alkylphenolicus]
MQDLPSSDSSLINQIHREVIAYSSNRHTGATLEFQGPAMLSYEFPCRSQGRSGQNLLNDQHGNDYFQVFQLSEELYSGAVYLTPGRDFSVPRQLKNLMGFVIGYNFESITPAGLIGCSTEEPIAYLCSYPDFETGIYQPNLFTEHKLICIYFDRDCIEKSLGMNREGFPSSLTEFYETSSDKCMYMPISLSHGAKVLAEELLLSPMKGPLRYRQFSAGCNYLLLQLLQALADLDSKVDTYSDRLDFARRLLMEDLQSQYTLEQIASKVGIGKTKFALDFREKYGLTATDFRREVRLKEAFRLLRHTNKPIAIIAEETGFSGNNKLSTLFKKRFGVSPRDARKTGQLKTLVNNIKP